MLCYFNYYIPEKHDKANEHSIFYIGRFGEDLLFTKLPDGTYIFSSLVLELWDLYLDEKSKESIIKSYCIDKVDNFNVKNKFKMDCRVSNLGEVMYNLYIKYLETNDKYLITLIEHIIFDVEEFKLSDKRYIDWFITFGGEEHWDYINFILDLRRKMKGE